MEKEQHYLNINKNTELKKIMELKENEIKLFLFVCSQMTFKQNIFGVFSKKSLSSISNALDIENIQTKRILAKLEKKELLFVINQNENLILSKTKITTDELKTIIEQNYADFNIRKVERLKELIKFFNWKNFDYKAIYATKPVEATKPPTTPQNSLKIVPSEIPGPTDSILDDWDEIVKRQISIS